jgi:hypothetical protein
MTPKVRKRAAAVVVHTRADETSLPETGERGAIGADPKTDGETRQSPSPWPAQFGWDFPFDFPKQTR